MCKKVIITAFIVVMVGCRPPLSQREPATQATGSLGSSELTRSPVRIAAVLPKNVVGAGDVVTVHLELTFSGSVIYLEENDFFHRFHPKVSLASGVALGLSREGAFYEDDHTGGSMQVAKVGPHYTDVYDFEVSKLFDLSKPGDYQIYFVRNACNAPQVPEADAPRLPEPQFVGQITSNTVHLQVVPSENQHLRKD